MTTDRSTGCLVAVLVCAAGASACGDGAAYPAELEGHHDVTGRAFCQYTIDGHSEIFVEGDSISIWPPRTDNVDCDGDFYIESHPNPGGGSCARIVSDGATLVADLTFYRDADHPEFGPYFASSDPGFESWNLEEGVEYTGTLRYRPDTRLLTVEYDGTGVAGRFSTQSGTGTVHCVYEATVE